MASTFSPSLRIELIGDGDQSGIWGQTTNNNLGALIEQAVAGVITITMVDANYTLTNFNGVVDEARNQVIVLTGTNAAQRNLIAPLVEKTYTIKNSTIGGFAVQIIGSSGTGVVIPNGVTVLVYCDGTNFYQAVSSEITSLNTANYTIEQQGTTLVTQYNGANVTTLTSTGTLNVVQALNTPVITVTTANAPTVNATTVNATTTNATNFRTANFTITESGGKLQFRYGSTVVMSIDSAGNVISTANITAYGTP